MATANLGRIGFVNKGTYNSATAYKVNDVVVYNGGTYACIQANTGQAPTNTSYWQNWVADNAVHKTGDETIVGTKTFTSSPIVPTPTAGDNSTKIATTSYVKAEIPNALNASGTAPIYACRAWVNFNGTGTVAIRGSGNVSSVTDNGTGSYIVNFITAMPDANYAANTVQRSNSYTGGLLSGSRSTTSVRLTYFDANGLIDREECGVSIFR